MKLIDADNRTNVFRDNNLIGYWDHETEMLYGINSKGYAVEIALISHRSDIVSSLSFWRQMAL